MKNYKAVVKDKQTGERKIIEREYKTKQKFIQDLRGNGYCVNEYKVKETDEFDWIMENTNCEIRDWRRGFKI